MIAIGEAQALAVLASYGLSPESARLELQKIRPCAQFSGAPYYAPSPIYRAAKRKAARHG